MSKGTRFTESFLINGDIISGNFLGLKYYLVLGTERKQIKEVEPKNTNLTLLNMRFIGISKTCKIWGHYFLGESSDGGKKKKLEKFLFCSKASFKCFSVAICYLSILKIILAA